MAKDPYLNKNGVLKNKLNIKDAEELKQAEADIGFIKLITVDSVDVKNFDCDTLKRIHKHIFGDIYDWAGEYRVMPLFKEEVVLPCYSIPYAPPKEVEKRLKERLADLNDTNWEFIDKKEIASVYARKIALIWRVHPFRDGNTRSVLCFSYLFAKEHGFPFDIKTFIQGLYREYYENGMVKNYNVRDKFVLACLDDKDYPEVEPLANVFEEAMKNISDSEKLEQNKRR